MRHWFEDDAVGQCVGAGVARGATERVFHEAGYKRGGGEPREKDCLAGAQLGEERGLRDGLRVHGGVDLACVSGRRAGCGAVEEGERVARRGELDGDGCGDDGCEVWARIEIIHDWGALSKRMDQIGQRLQDASRSI